MAKAKSAGSGAEKPKSNPAIDTPIKKTASKAVWSGFITAFGIMTIPAKAYKACDEDSISRNMYHSTDCMNRLKQQAMKCSGCGQEVAEANAIKAVTVNDKIVVITDEEMAAQRPASEEKLAIFEFVPADTIDVTYYASSEYLAAGDGGAEAFANFRAGLALSGRVAIGRMVQRGHEFYVAIRPFGQHGLVMSYLFAEYEVRSCDKWATNIDVKMSDVEVFAQLMSETEYAKDKFTPAPYDSFLRNVRTMIAKKAAGETVETVKAEEAPQGGMDMMAAMKEMLKNAKSKGKAAGKK
jgi:DNA end-binding protein Ku